MCGEKYENVCLQDWALPFVLILTFELTRKENTGCKVKSEIKETYNTSRESLGTRI